MQNKTIFIILGVIGGTLVLCGCCGVVGFFLAVPKIREAAERTNRLNDLKQVSLQAQNFYDANKRMPANAEDLRMYLENGPVFTRLKAGEIEVVWKAEGPTNQPKGSSAVLYAWYARPEANGTRLAVFMDGTAKILTEAEFQNTPKAAKK
jgi:hypothetical protein